MTKEKRWRFVPNLNATDDGLNDAGIETFSAKVHDSMIRETVQNSIDQRTENSEEPVLVEFDDFTIEKNQFPGGDQFEEILDKCIRSNSDDAAVVRFFKQAKDLMSKPIKVMRISDYNTTGLVGAETGRKGTPWHSLIKARGSSNKNIASGGSFGIGKSAPFACSNLRTVIYSSKVDEIVSYIGVSRLVSFEDEGHMTIGTGFYAEDSTLNAIRESFSFNDFKRSSNGTDIYIVGFDDKEDLKQIIKEATLSNFFITIWKGLLVVRYKDLEIHRDNLGQHIASLDDKKYFDLKQYYRLLVAEPTPDETEIKKIVLDNEEYGKRFDIKCGECTLLLMRGEDLNRRILMSRRPGMSLFLQGGINGSISFTGILMITGDVMNELFKEMEMPAHDAWEPERCKVDKQKYVKAYEELRKYLREKVLECFNQTRDEEILAYGMEEFFAGVDEAEGNVEVCVLEGKANIRMHRDKNRKSKKNRVVARDGSLDRERLSPDVSMTPAPTLPISPGPPRMSMTPKYKYVDIKKRLVCKDEKRGEYILRFSVPKKKKLIKLEFIGIAERGSYDLKLKTARVESGDPRIYQVHDNSIVLHDIPAKSDMVIHFSIDFNRKCMMEVNYYEA